MSLALTDEQKALRKTVRDFLERKSDEAAVREAMESELGFDRALWDQMGSQLGLQALAIFFNKRFWVGSVNGYIWYTLDGGKT